MEELDSPTRRQVFFLLQELMETVLVCEISKASNYRRNKIEELRDKLNSHLQHDFDISLEFIQDVWQTSLSQACQQVAKDEMIQISTQDLSWQQVFDTIY